MGFVSSILGGGAGAGYQAGSAGGQGPGNILNPSTAAQANEQYGNVQSGLGQQQAFLNALQGQGGIGNQDAVFRNQQALAEQLQQQALGQGPNPAQAALAQNTANNVSQQAALMAGQRGTGSNAGMIGRNIANQGANIQQQSAGQAATMQAQQQLAAQQALMQQQNAMQNVAGSQIANQAGALGGYNQMAQNAQQNILNSIAQQNNANVGMQSNINQANAGIAGVNAGTQGRLLGGALSGVGAAFGMAHGGEVPHYAEGGSVVGNFMSGFGRGSGYGNQGGPNQIAQQPGFVNTMQSQDPVSQGGFDFGKGLGQGIGKMFASSAPQSQAIASSLPGLAAVPMMGAGGKVNGQAKVNGDSLKNDTVPAMLSPGEIVLPRSVTKSANAPDAAAKFVAAVLAKRGTK